MPTRDEPWSAGTPCWVDLSSNDVEAAKDFYGKVFGWSFHDTGADFGNYQMCQVGDRNAAGIGGKQDPSVPTVWTVYLASEDCDASAKSIVEHGGTVLAEPFDVPESGRMCIAADSQGAVFGVWQARGHVGAGIYNEPGALTWTDAREPDPEDAKRFYAAVFGWTYQQVEGAPPDYATFHRDGSDPLGGIGGMMGAPDGTPAHWVPYFSVADADAAAEAAKSTGGTVLAGPNDTPYGRMIVIADPEGGRFTVLGPVPADA